MLQVQNVNHAILAMGRFARQQMLGKVIGVTGSAGKTSTVAMLTKALKPWGEVGHSRHNANLPHGIAWNLASIPWDATHTVLEMAIGRMAANSQLVKPDIALVTNIGPAHLEYHQDTAAIARSKSRIFEGMGEHGVAVLNRDMEHWDIVCAHARTRGLRVIHYGSHPQSDVRLIRYSAPDHEVSIRVGDADYHYRLGASGRHMAFNSMACVAVALALELPLDPMLTQFSLFRSLSGRGELLDVAVAGGKLRVMDEAYNANPLSMKAALALLADMSSGASSQGRKVAVLGDMLELGKEATELHAQLADAVLQAKPDLVLLCGEYMQALRDALGQELVTRWYPSVVALNAAIQEQLENGDLVLVKSSGGTGLSSTVALLREGS